VFVSSAGGAVLDAADSATRWFSDVGVASRHDVRRDSVITVSRSQSRAVTDTHDQQPRSALGRLRRAADEHVASSRDDDYSLVSQHQYPHQTRDRLTLQDVPQCVYRCDVDQFRQSTHQPAATFTRPAPPVQYVSDECQSQPADRHHYQLGTVRYPSTSQVP